MSCLIYSLVDPRTAEVRYIGKTVREFKERFRLHINASKRAKKPTHKEHWIRELISADLLPLMEILEDVSIEKWRDREQYWIKYYRDRGCKLTNATDGGDGSVGTKHTDDWKKNLSDRLRGNKYSVGVKWTPDQREKMKSRIPWNKGKRGLQLHSAQWKKEASTRMSGDNHPMRKLNANQVLEVRSLFNGSNGKELAAQFSVSYSHILRITKKRIWKCL